MFQLYSHHQTYLQSLVELYMLNAYAMWDPSSEANIFTDFIHFNPLNGSRFYVNHSVG
jgi:hypothetical protein